MKFSITKKLLLSVAVTASALSATFAQMSYWTALPQKINVGSASPTYTTLSGNLSAQSISNGAYDENGVLLFHVSRHGIFSGNGTLIQSLPFREIVCSEFNVLGGEIAIVPIAGTCKQFYVIYSMRSPVLGGGSDLLYVKVDCSTTTPTVITNGLGYNCATTLYKPRPFTINGHFGTNNVAFAVSKVFTGSGASAKRYLFSTGSNGIVRSEISSSGISDGVVIATPSALNLTGSDLEGLEAELSWGTNYFAWSAPLADKIHFISLSSGNYVNASIRSQSVPDPVGVEFSSSLTTPKLYVSGLGSSSGLRQILTSNNSMSVIATGGYSMSDTFLEYAKNGKIYGISGNNLVGISPDQNLVSVVTIPTQSICYNIGFSFIPNPYSLPDQIDGENYDYYNAPTFLPFDPVCPTSDNKVKVAAQFTSGMPGTWQTSSANILGFKTDGTQMNGTYISQSSSGSSTSMVVQFPSYPKTVKVKIEVGSSCPNVLPIIIESGLIPASNTLCALPDPDPNEARKGLSETIIKLYPNPAAQEFTIRLAAGETSAKVCIRDAAGKIQRNFSLTANETTVSLQGLAAGWYNVAIQTATMKENQKLLVQP